MAPGTSQSELKVRREQDDTAREAARLKEPPTHADVQARQAIGIEQWGWYSIAVNVILGSVNLVVALASGSLAVRAEMIHNAVDLLTAIAVLVGLRLSTRKSVKFPYGLYKLENVITIFLALMVFLTAYEVARDALASVVRKATVNLWMLVGVAVALVIPLVFSRYELRAGRAANSPALIADAREYRVHVFTTGVVLASLLSQWFGLPLDRVASLVVVVAITKTGWDLLVDGMRVLLDASLEPETLEGIRKVIADDPRVAEVRWVTGHNAGRFRFAEAGVTLRVSDSQRMGDTTARIEERIRETVPHIERVLVHPEQAERSALLYGAPLADPDGTLSEHFGEAPYFGFPLVRQVDRAIVEQHVLANPHQNEEKAKGIKVAEWLVAQKVDTVFLKESLQGKGPEYVFDDAGVAMQLTSAGTLTEAVARGGKP